MSEYLLSITWFGTWSTNLKQLPGRGFKRPVPTDAAVEAVWSSVLGVPSIATRRSSTQLDMLYTDLRSGQTCHSKVMHRKEVTQYDGSYEKKLNRVSGISTKTMHQSTTPSLSQTIWPRWESRQFLSLHIVETLLPVTFGYSLSSEAVVMRQLRIWKRLWRRSLTRSHKRTSMGRSRSCWNGTKSTLQPEEITSNETRVSCVSIKVPNRKKSGTLSYAPRICFNSIRH